MAFKITISEKKRLSCNYRCQTFFCLDSSVELVGMFFYQCSLRKCLQFFHYDKAYNKVAVTLSILLEMNLPTTA